MAQRNRSVIRSVVFNIWLIVCIAAAASCTVLVLQLLLRAPPLTTEVLKVRLALSVPALFGALAGLYGAVVTVLLALRSAKVVRLQHRLDGLRRRAGELETSHLSQRVRIDELATLREVATVVNQESDFAIIAEKVLELICGLLEPLEATIFLRGEDKPGMVPLAQCAGGKVLTGRKIASRDIPGFSVRDFERHSVICRVHGQELHALVPLKVEEDVEGVLQLVFPADSRAPGLQTAEFNRARRRLLLDIAHHISLAVKAKHLQAKAVVDGLTRLYTRSHFNTEIRAAVELSRRTQETFALVLIDIDHFKVVNDTHGHAAGDEVLRRVAKRIRASLRKYDAAYRYGGEELAVLLPRADMRQAVGTAERLRCIIEAQKVRAEGSLISVTVSIGVAHFQPDDDADSIFGRADRRLYRAKDQGRNRVVPAAA